MINKRRLGRILLRDDPENEKPISKLGFDPLLDLPSPKIFCEKLLKRKIPIKALLLDQGFSAGVGNWIADEILYQAKIAPGRVSNTLSEAEAKCVRQKMKSIIDKAVSVDADKSRFPRTWLFHHRWGKNTDAKTSKGEKIIHEQHGVDIRLPAGADRFVAGQELGRHVLQVIEVQGTGLALVSLVDGLRLFE